MKNDFIQLKEKLLSLNVFKQFRNLTKKEEIL